MISDPFVEVECDACQADMIRIRLTPLARSSYDERNVRVDILDHDWTIDGDKTYCPECKPTAGDLYDGAI